MKLGKTCHISTLPKDVFPVDIAFGIQLIANGNNVTTEEDEVDKFTVLLDDGQLDENEEYDLHPDISNPCSGLSYRKFTEAPINKTQNEALNNGEVIFLESKLSRSCPVQVY